jgi:hypothetical protein
MDEVKIEVAWIFAGPKPGASTRKKAEKWRLKWKVPSSNTVVERRFNIKAKPVRCLGFFLDPKFNWQAHVKHRLALGHHRVRAVAMSTAAYAAEAIWEGQKWLSDGFEN